MKKTLAATFLLVCGSALLGATVFREPIARAAQTVGATIVGPLDGNGDVAVHEQGTAAVEVTNDTLSVHPSTASKGGYLLISSLDAGKRASASPSLDAQLIAVTATKGEGFIQFGDGLGHTLLALSFEPGHDLIFPLTQILPLGDVTVDCSGSSPTPCAVSISYSG
jgi:hypothetical protein